MQGMVNMVCIPTQERGNEKHELKCKAYLRYVDDFILLHADAEQLTRWHGSIADFLAQRLSLSLRQNVILKPVSAGADFLGYIVRPHYKLVRRRVVGNLRDKLVRFQRQFNGSRKHDGGCTLHLKPVPREQLRSVLASYFGHFRHANAYQLVQQLIREFSWLQLLFDLDQAPHGILPRWEPARVSGYRSQLRFFRRQFPNAVVHVQRGREVDRLAAPETRVVRPGDGLRAGVTRVIVREEGYLHGGLKRRLVTHINFMSDGSIP
jgi:hypothetical protein